MINIEIDNFLINWYCIFPNGYRSNNNQEGKMKYKSILVLVVLCFGVFGSGNLIAKKFVKVIGYKDIKFGMTLKESKINFPKKSFCKNKFYLMFDAEFFREKSVICSPGYKIFGKFTPIIIKFVKKKNHFILNEIEFSVGLTKYNINYFKKIFFQEFGKKMILSRGQCKNIININKTFSKKLNLREPIMNFFAGCQVLLEQVKENLFGPPSIRITFYDIELEIK